MLNKLSQIRFCDIKSCLFNFPPVKLLPSYSKLFFATFFCYYFHLAWRAFSSDFLNFLTHVFIISRLAKWQFLHEKMFSLESLVAMIFDVYKQLSGMKISFWNVAKTKADKDHFSDVF
jgi:hypothetical protein